MQSRGWGPALLITGNPFDAKRRLSGDGDADLAPIEAGAWAAWAKQDEAATAEAAPAEARVGSRRRAARAPPG